MTDCTNTKNKIQASYGSTACGVCTTDSLSLISNHNSYINNKFNHYLYSDIGSLFPENDSSLKNCDNSLKNCDNSLKNCDNSLMESDNWNSYSPDSRCYVEKLGKQLKDLLKCININDSYLSNYETITVVGK